MVKKGRKSSRARRKAKKPGSSRAPRAVGRAQPALRHGAAAQLENVAGAAVGLPHPTARARFAATTAERARLEHSVELERTERMAAHDAAIQAIARKLAVALKDQFPQLAPIPPEST